VLKSNLKIRLSGGGYLLVFQSVQRFDHHNSRHKNGDCRCIAEVFSSLIKKEIDKSHVTSTVACRLSQEMMPKDTWYLKIHQADFVSKHSPLFASLDVSKFPVFVLQLARSLSVVEAFASVIPGYVSH
jgi:hypothetical protein